MARFSVVLRAQRISTGRVAKYVLHLKKMAVKLPVLAKSERGPEEGHLNSSLVFSDDERSIVDRLEMCWQEHWPEIEHYPNVAYSVIGPFIVTVAGLLVPL